MKSVWMDGGSIGKREPLSGDMEVPVVVIGAGLAGILTAYYLKQEGIRAVVLEADRIGSGQTKNTTAKITSQHNLIYSRLIRTFGCRMAEHYARANEAAIGEYERLVREKGIDCDFVRCPACLYSRTETEILKREAEAAESLGIRASFETDCELPFPVAGVTKFARQARFHPLKFLAGMAEHVVFTSHYPFLNVPGYYFARMYQERSYVMALEGTGRPTGMYLGIDEGGLSLRSCGDLLLLGGGSHRTGVNPEGRTDAECRYGMLQNRAQEIYPGCREVYRWSAQDCMTLDGLPYIGRFSGRRPCWYVAAGFGKWGMTSAMVSARILTALITGRDCPEADIFSPNRPFTARAAKELAVHAAYTVKGLTKHLLPAGKGKVSVNGEMYAFDGAEGYWEGDRGRSFPKEYIWTQCSFPEGALMLSVADIPMAGFHFRGVIGVVVLDGREYRLATYLGAKTAAIGNGRVRVIQGRMELEAELLERTGKPLMAPAQGDMVRTIRESAACRAKYRFRKDNRTLLSFETDRASFEYEYR